LILAFALGAVFAHDLIVPRGWGARAALGAISQYRAHVSPHLRGVVACRFRPTCSVYGYQSIQKHGLFVGGMKAVWRIARCGPWTPLGTYDPP
jgi:uncharacterized protein